MPEVSIILPVYNEEKHLAKTLSALLSQTFFDFELIAVDDGSTDRSREILNTFAAVDPRITVLAQRHGGVSRARNLALEAAEGTWVWFTDSDDLPFTDFLEKALSEPLSRHAALLTGSYLRCDPSGTVTRVMPPEIGLVSPEALPVYFMQTQYETGYFGYLWNKLLRREKILSTGAVFDESMTLAEDLQFLLKLYRADCKALFAPYCAMQYTAHPLRREADHYKQLILQKDIFDWIVTEQKHTEYLPFFRRKLSEYASYAVFYAPEMKENPVERAKKILADDEICAQLAPSETHGIFKIITRCLKYKNIPALKLYLAAYHAGKQIKTVLKGGFHRAIHSV